MRLALSWLLFWVSTAVAASAGDMRPAEEPPPDFAQPQFVDSRGCVFLRDDAGRWQARLARDGSAICGFAPTASIRGVNGQVRLRALDPNAGKTRAELVEEALVAAVIPNLAPGELASDPRSLESLPDMGPEPMATGPLDALRASLRAAPTIREAMAQDLKPNRRLCRLLGYDEHPAEGAQGSDPTSGYCGKASETALDRLAFVRPVDVTPARGAAHSPQTGKIAVAAGPRLPLRQGETRKLTPPLAAMIPAGARYVQLGAFVAGAEADQVVGRVRAMGFGVQRDKASAPARPVLLAGPFDTREQIVRALDRLRRDGFDHAAPR